MSNPYDEAKRLFTEEDVEIGSHWMVNRLLSFSPASIMFSIKINQASWKVPQKYLDALFNCCPKAQRAPWLRYAKRKKEVEPKLVAAISKHFCVNKYHADQIIDLLRLQGEKPETYFGLKEGE